MNKTEFNQGLLNFIEQSPTPFHAVETLSAALLAHGFQPLNESDNWQVQPKGKYFVTRNASSIIAFTIGEKAAHESGWRMVGAHTDSPCLKLKPNALHKGKSYWQFGVEVYGGVLLSPWFDRDLSLAGRVSFTRASGALESCLIDFKKAVAQIPSLAIHLDRDVNNSRSINAQTQMSPIVALVSGDETIEFDGLLKEQIQSQHGINDITTILDFELSLYDFQAPALTGLRDEFISAARLDNLLSCYVGLQAIIAADGNQNTLLVCNDHEEIGSQSAIGAQGPMLANLLERLEPDIQLRQQALARSMMVSADNAHGVHPNFSEKHDKHHGPILNAGPVIKVNANHRYATNSETSAVFKTVAAAAKVPVQTFVSRADMGCGSTIGPLTSAAVGVNTLDVGVPTFAMHSIRETAGADDAFSLFLALSQFHALDQLPI